MSADAAELSRAIDAVRGSARFEDACHDYSTGMIAFYRSDPLRPLLLADLGRLGVIAALMVGSPPVWVSGLARMSGGLSGRARIAGHLHVLARTGMTRPCPVAGRRLRAIAPTRVGGDDGRMDAGDGRPGGRPGPAAGGRRRAAWCAPTSAR